MKSEAATSLGASTFLALLGLGLGAAAPAATDEPICDWVEAHLERSTEVVDTWALQSTGKEEFAATPWTSCASVWTCVAETHRSLPTAWRPGHEHLAGDEPAAEAEGACEQLGTILGTGSEGAREALSRIEEADLDQGDPEGSQGTMGHCAFFLECLLDKATDVDGEGTAPTSPAAEQRPAAERAGNWQEEFERLCGKVAAAPSLTADQLRQLVKDCEALEETIRRLDDPRAKIYLFRLEKCREFFEYTLALRDSPTSADEP